MVFGKIKPVATIVAQFAAGVEVECIQHEGKMYMPVIGGDFDTTDSGKKSEDGAPKKPAPKPSKEEPADEKTYTEDELMGMEVKELTKILKNDFKINPDDFDGKNTNKKLRNLILDAQEKGGDNSSDAEAEDEKPAPKKGKSKVEEEEETEDGSDDELIDNIADVLEDFDSGKKNKKKAVAAIIAFAENEDDVDATAVSEALSDFEDDEKASIDVMAEQIAKLLTKKKGKSTAAKSKKKPAEPEGEDVEIDDLEKGDLVAVYWDDEETKGWFNGKVSSIKKGIVKVKYDDGSEDDLDPEVHTKIRRLEE